MGLSGNIKCFSLFIILLSSINTGEARIYTMEDPTPFDKPIEIDSPPTDLDTTAPQDINNEAKIQLENIGMKMNKDSENPKLSESTFVKLQKLAMRLKLTTAKHKQVLPTLKKLNLELYYKIALNFIAIQDALRNDANANILNKLYIKSDIYHKTSIKIQEAYEIVLLNQHALNN